MVTFPCQLSWIQRCLGIREAQLWVCLWGHFQRRLKRSRGRSSALNVHSCTISWAEIPDWAKSERERIIWQPTFVSVCFTLLRYEKAALCPCHLSHQQLLLLHLRPSRLCLLKPQAKQTFSPLWCLTLLVQQTGSRIIYVVHAMSVKDYLE